MPIPRVRFTVRGMFVAVAIVAVLTPFPLAALVFSMITFTLWFSIPIAVVLLLDRVGGRAAAVAASSLVTIVGTSLLCWPRYMLYLTWPRFMLHSPVEVATWLLTPINLFGPLNMVTRYWRGRPLAAGEILWGWVGLAWAMLLVTPELHRMHSGRIARLEMMAECARLTLALAVCVWAWAPKPTGPGRAWGHYFGWALVECDVLAWGWFAWSGR